MSSKVTLISNFPYDVHVLLHNTLIFSSEELAMIGVAMDLANALMDLETAAIVSMNHNQHVYVNHNGFINFI